jgi:group I intron endonuclease
VAAGIYKITNLVNGKFYIGSSTRLNSRKAEHKYKMKNYKGNSIIRNAVLKYGEDSFSFEIMEVVSEDLYPERTKLNLVLTEKEQFYINLLKPYYNIRLIDVTRNVGVCSEKQREHLRRISKIPKGHEFYQKMGLNKRGKYLGENNKKSIKVDVYSYPSLEFVETVIGIRNCERKYGVSSTSIYQICKNGLSKSSNFKSNYVFRYHDESLDLLFHDRKVNKGYLRKDTIPVIQIDKDGKFIKEWRTGSDAEKELNLYKGAVSRIISGQYKHSKGYYFKHKNLNNHAM